MIVHIVMFAFKKEQKSSNIRRAKEMLLALQNEISGLVSIEVGENFSDESRAMDLSIITHFHSKADLQSYANHPKHLVVVEFIKSVVEYSKVVDYETK